jgi:hypothetical protein
VRGPWLRAAPAGMAGLWLLSGLGLWGLAAHAQPGSLEYPVKAAYLPKFAPFVDWPERAFDGPGSPYVICIQGPDPFGALLDQAVRGQKAGARGFLVKRIAGSARDEHCQMLYIGLQDPAEAAEALAAARGAPILTVTDGARQSAARGVIHFTLKDNRVRFDIDDQAAADNGLTVSSKLMSLALNVRRRR